MIRPTQLSRYEEWGPVHVVNSVALHAHPVRLGSSDERPDLELRDERKRTDSRRPSVPHGWVEGSRRRDQGCRSSPGGGPQDDHQAEGRALEDGPEDRSGELGDWAQERKSKQYRGLGKGALWDRDQATRHGEL
ncbi:hypothetical protein EYF80_040087 [Liparis tanakae]|uniref:Uncharacterized protein n=1 Tax=Liparis tanakae TaxID=230148 RepID=A0A4Z2G812_9TELE|nr:hypothetical protein EYF80_040087 [Liparis tanakae]